MGIAVSVVGVLMVLVGFGWFLQGINVLPGSFMTGEIQWAFYGGILVVAGLALLGRFGTRKIILNSVAVILLLMGTVWFLQGIGVLPGSFMTGQPKWAVYGGIADCVGVALLIANRGKTTARA